MRLREWVILSGTASRPLAQKICEKLGKPLGRCDIRRFSDGEIFIEIGENVRGRDVYIIQSTARPVNDSLMELLIMIDALKRASAKEITAVIPYYGYARQDRKVAPRTPISAKLTADLLTAAGATRVVSMELHAGQIQGFFDIPFDNLFASPVMLEHLRKELAPVSDRLVMVSPDAGGVERARYYAKHLDATVAVIDKRRTGDDEHAVPTSIVGDVKGRHALIVDDEIATGGTILEAAELVLRMGALSAEAAVVHPVLSGNALPRLRASRLSRLRVTDTIPVPPEKSDPRIEVVSVAPLLAEAIRRLHAGESLNDMASRR